MQIWNNIFDLFTKVWNKFVFFATDHLIIIVVYKKEVNNVWTINKIEKVAVRGSQMEGGGQGVFAKVPLYKVAMRLLE